MCQSGLKGLTMGSNGSSSMHGVFYSIGMNIPTFGINGHCTETSVTQSYIHRYILHFGFFESFLDRRGTSGTRGISSSSITRMMVELGADQAR